MRYCRAERDFVIEKSKEEILEEKQTLYLNLYRDENIGPPSPGFKGIRPLTKTERALTGLSHEVYMQLDAERTTITFWEASDYNTYSSYSTPDRKKYEAILEKYWATRDKKMPLKTL